MKPEAINSKPAAGSDAPSASTCVTHGGKSQGSYARDERARAAAMAILGRMISDPRVCGPNRGRESDYSRWLLRAGFITREHVSMREYFYHVTAAGRAAFAAMPGLRG